jgi:hypothetical protein
MSYKLRPAFMPTAKTAMALVALALMSGIGAAQAQSSYALTKLSEPFLGKHGAAGYIDSQNRVTASLRYASGYRLFDWATPPGFTYTWYVSRWPASVAASVSPSKLINQTQTFKHQSPDGSKVFASSPNQYYDTVKRQFVAVPPPNDNQYWDVAGINDSGAMAGTAFLYSGDPIAPAIRAIRWTSGAAAPEVLPIGAGFDRASSAFINQRGAVAGEVGMTGSSLTRAAIWRESGAFEVLNNEPDTHSRPLGMTDAGDVLVWIEKADNSVYSFAVISHGVAKAIEAPTPDVLLFPTAINASGVVVGKVTQPSAPEGFRDRAFIWKDGVFTDLTAWVTAKGVKLPTGAVISEPWQINAQGSILATLREANGKTTVVRLTAKP